MFGLAVFTRVYPCPRCELGTLVDDGDGGKVCLLCSRSPGKVPAFALAPKKERRGPRVPHFPIREGELIDSGVFATRES